ncbi:hypothetical protein SNE40_002926 [Patella caerulea]|uniref:Uncharacterized protein n=1 Tax=Patella caerulea TaxID=87958 RepID=A0AAN8K9R6_PATCE
MRVVLNRLPLVIPQSIPRKDILKIIKANWQSISKVRDVSVRNDTLATRSFVARSNSVAGKVCSETGRSVLNGLRTTKDVVSEGESEQTTFVAGEQGLSGSEGQRNQDGGAHQLDLSGIQEQLRLSSRNVEQLSQSGRIQDSGRPSLSCKDTSLGHLNSTYGGLSRLNNDTVSILNQGNGISSHDALYVANISFKLQQGEVCELCCVACTTPY